MDPESLPSVPHDQHYHMERVSFRCLCPQLFSRKHGLLYMQHRRRSKKPESLRLEETAVVREAQKLIQTVEADET
jgi:hypothetical protein